MGLFESEVEFIIVGRVSQYYYKKYEQNPNKIRTNKLRTKKTKFFSRQSAARRIRKNVKLGSEKKCSKSLTKQKCMSFTKIPRTTFLWKT